MSGDQQIHQHGVDYDIADSQYLEARQLKKSATGWLLLAALGVAYVIAGEFAAWNYGIDQAGWGGMILALLLMAVMYFCLVFSLAELASIIPTAGGGYGFARRAFGPAAGFLTGLAIVFEYVLATAGVALFFEAYFRAITGIGGLPVIITLFAVFFVIHVRGASESLKLILGLAAIAALGLIVFAIMMALRFDMAKLFDIPSTAAWGASAFLPFGFAGIWAGFPFAIAMFLGIEGVPMASEETANPQRDVPRGMMVAIVVLFVISTLILVTAPGGAGSSRLGEGEDPLMVALIAAYGPDSIMRYVISGAALVGITTSFFSLMFGYSRQIFALSRAGYLPRFLSVTNTRGAPYLAILIPGTISFALTLTRAAEQIIIIVVFCATFSYLLMAASHIRLRRTAPHLRRPYKTPGGTITSTIAFMLALLAFAVCISANPLWSFYSGALLAAGFLYFWCYSRHHLVAQAPEEEFETASAGKA